MITLLITTTVLLFGVGRVSAALLATACLSVFVIVEPALLTSGLGAFLLAGAFLFASIHWLYPAFVDGQWPTMLVRETPNFTIAGVRIAPRVALAVVVA